MTKLGPSPLRNLIPAAPLNNPTANVPAPSGHTVLDSGGGGRRVAVDGGGEGGNGIKIGRCHLYLPITHSVLRFLMLDGNTADLILYSYL